VADKALTTENRKQFKKLIKIVDDGLATFIDVGNALREIRQNELYIESHSSFESFVKDRFELSKSRAYQFIDAAEIESSIECDQKPKNESQYRELAKVPEESVSEVWNMAQEKAKELETPVTANIIKASASDFFDKSSDGEPESTIVDEPGDNPITIDAEFSAVETDEDIAEPSFDELVSDDEEETPYSERALANRNFADAIRSQINEAIKLINNLPDVEGMEKLGAKSKSILNDLNNAKGSIINATPHAICPACDGEQCPKCGNYGWVNSALNKELTSN